MPSSRPRRRASSPCPATSPIPATGPSSSPPLAVAIDLLVNNAGGLGPSPLPGLADYPLDELADLFTVNVVAPLGLIQDALPKLAAGAVIVDITSDASVEAYEGWGGYGATKAALDHLGRVLAVERPDLRVLTVDPGDMRTQMHQDAFPGEDISDRPPPEESVPGILALIDGDRPERPLTERREVVPVTGDGRPVGRLRAPARARGDRASRAHPRPARRGAHARLDRRRRAQAHHRPRPRHVAAAGRRRRRQHVGDGAGGRGRDHGGRRPRSWSTSRPSCPPACTSSRSVIRRASARPNRTSPTSPGPRWRCRTVARSTSSDGCPGRCGSGSRRSTCPPRCSTTCAGTAARSAIGTSRTRGRSTPTPTPSPPSPARRRCRRPGGS